MDCIHPGKTSEKDSPLFQESMLARAPVHRAHFRQRAERLRNSGKPHRAGNGLAMKKTIADSVARVRDKRNHIRGNTVFDEKDTVL